eukprot:CFRG5682T1
MNVNMLFKSTIIVLAAITMIHGQDPVTPDMDLIPMPEESDTMIIARRFANLDDLELEMEDLTSFDPVGKNEVVIQHVQNDDVKEFKHRIERIREDTKQLTDYSTMYGLAVGCAVFGGIVMTASYISDKKQTKELPL